MYQIKIENTVESQKDFIVANGEQMVDENNQLLEYQTIDGNGDPVVDENGDPAMEPAINDTGVDQVVKINKTAQEIADDEIVLKSSKENEIQSKVDAYIAAQQYQLQNGGPGPVGDFEIMKIVNEHNGQFEVVFKEAGE